MKHLTPYAAQTFAALQRLLPDLAALAFEQADYFEIRTTSPSGQPLWISAAEDELTVGFAEHHTHFGWHEGGPLVDAATAAAYVQELRAGQLVIVARYRRERFVSSMTQEVSQLAAQPQLTWFQRWWRRKQHQVVRRWAA